MVDETKLLTVRNYAKSVGKTTAWIYELVKREELPVKRIDGVLFIVTE